MNGSNPFAWGEFPTAPFQNDSSQSKLIEILEKCSQGAVSIFDVLTKEVAFSRHRRSDEEFSEDETGLDKTPEEFDIGRQVPLSVAVNQAERTPGVYILYLDGVPMKCGRAAYGGGVAWRLRQYYNLNYDDRARDGDYWSVSAENRNRITVSWQCCPPSVCGELEYKLFQKYGKGPWAKRAPELSITDCWKLLI